MSLSSLNPSRTSPKSLPFLNGLKRAGDFALSWFFPDVFQICESEKATRDIGYVGHLCRSKPGNIKCIAGPVCDCCGFPFEGEISSTFLCGYCQEMPKMFRRARAGVKLDGVVQQAIHRFKYNHALYFEPFLVELLLMRALPAIQAENWDLIIPIPLHRSRQRKRDFNQSERIAKHLARKANIPLKTRVIVREGRTETQTHLSREQRVENVKRAFKFSGQYSVKDAKIILVDDVLTTGATASACAKVLRDNGAAVVDVWTVARGGLK